MTDRPTTNPPTTNLTTTDLQSQLKGLWLPWSRRFATAHSTRRACDGLSGTMPAARSTA